MLALGSPSANWKLWLFVSAMDSRRNKVHNRIYHCSFTSRNVGRWDSCSQEFLEDWHRLGIELVFHIFPRSDFLWIHQIQQRTFMDETAERTQMRMHLWRPLHLWHPCSWTGWGGRRRPHRHFRSQLLDFFEQPVFLFYGNLLVTGTFFSLLFYFLAGWRGRRGRRGWCLLLGFLSFAPPPSSRTVMGAAPVRIRPETRTALIALPAPSMAPLITAPALVTRRASITTHNSHF